MYHPHKPPPDRYLPFRASLYYRASFTHSSHIPRLYLSDDMTPLIGYPEKFFCCLCSPQGSSSILYFFLSVWAHLRLASGTLAFLE